MTRPLAESSSFCDII